MEDLLAKVSYALGDYWDDKGDPRINKLPLFSGGPTKILLLISVYLFFIKYLGPKLMATRKPFELKTAIIFHNGVLCSFSLSAAVVIFWFSGLGHKTWSCARVDPNSTDFNDNILVYGMVLYLFSKLMAMMETVFYVLRKKNNQANLLHIIHHSSVPLFTYIGLKMQPGGNSMFFGLVNALVHFLMYFYFLVSAFGPQTRKLLWWKEYITQIQIIQFVLVVGHALYRIIYPDCGWSKPIAIMYLVFGVIMFILFSHLYVQKYVVTKNENQTENNNLTKNEKLK